MPIRVEQSIDDPIITFTFEGIVDAETVQEANDRLAQAVNAAGLIYVILDLRDTEMTQGEAVALIESQETPALIANPRIRTVFIGQPVPHDPTRPTQTPVFANEEDALKYIRKDIATNAPKSSDN